MTDEEKKLQLSFDLRTIEHLGIKMYSRISNAIAELIANAYDADATKVAIKLYDDGDKKRIEVSDDGHGMDFDEVNDKFLHIGRNRRNDDATKSPNGRTATGKKGLGKLALFGLGDLIEITTTKKNSEKKLKFTLDWADMKTKEGNYEPPYDDNDKCPIEEQGTSIILRDLRRKSPFNKEDLANSLSRLFDCFGEGFRCSITLNDDKPIKVDNKLKFDNIVSQFNWKFPDDFEGVKPDYPYRGEISGKIISTEKPLSPGFRGVTLFANGRLVNTSEFFGIIESSNVFSYLTGWLNVDFIDDIKEDAIATNRQSLDWELLITRELREFIVAVIRYVINDWRKKRKTLNKKPDPDGFGDKRAQWLETFPKKEKEETENIFNVIENDDGVSTETHNKIEESLQILMPSYPLYHWRHLHDGIKEVAEEPYKKQEYYKAIEEAIKRYVRAVRIKSGNLPDKDHPLMGRAFGFENGMPKLLSVTKKYKRPDGSDFSSKTIENIEIGQRELSQGIIHGCRNPLAHEGDIDLRDSGLFNEKDCLDALSLLSHLFRRLEDA